MYTEYRRIQGGQIQDTQVKTAAANWKREEEEK